MLKPSYSFLRPVRGAHLEEKMDKVSEHIERLVQLIKGDEGSETKDDDITVCKGGEKGKDSDDEDYRIEEI
ncbi:hypothetical protein ID866_4520 [Astraeus odoratus]|nr:hypothetical protein ID866_4520 [Astraeus odoratus]